jgi:RNA polymerase sigma-70 factor (ECF subfamily)
MKAFQNLHRFRGNAKFSTWLVRIAMNEAFRTLRKQRSNRDQPVDTGVFAGHNKGHDPLDLTEWAATPESLYRANELRQILENCLQKLQARLRVVFILRDMEGHSVSEISGILNLSATAVRTRLSRARFQLREELTPYFKRTSTVTKSRPKRH